ncbi:MAG: class D beta-lactamase [Gammaproteobacteria bacterium]
MISRAALFVLLAAYALPIARAATVCTAVADARTGNLLREDGDCDRRVTPASTFKIAISLMGYDSGFLIDEHSPALPFHTGYPDWIPAWRASTDPTSWIKNSVVWYSQQVTKSLGDDKFRHYMKVFDYGNQDICGDPGKHDGLTQAWLSSSLKISPREQIAFLQKVVGRRLPISAHAYEMTSRITAIGVLPNGWEIHGKTGTGSPIADGSEDNAGAYGWFVGWAMKERRTLVFARLIQDHKEEPLRAGLRAREAFLADAPSILDTLSKR